jgi:hypothetical protein
MAQLLQKDPRSALFLLIRSVATFLPVEVLFGFNAVCFIGNVPYGAFVMKSTRHKRTQRAQENYIEFFALFCGYPVFRTRYGTVQVIVTRPQMR